MVNEPGDRVGAAPAELQLGVAPPKRLDFQAVTERWSPSQIPIPIGAMIFWAASDQLTGRRPRW